MTEAEWLSCTTKPKAMLARVAGKASGRKLQLLACAVCRLVWDAVPEPACRVAVEAAELLADGLLDSTEFQWRAQAARDEQAALFAEYTRLGIADWQWYSPEERPSAEIASLRLRVDGANVVLAVLAEELVIGLRTAIDWGLEVSANHLLPANRPPVLAAIRAAYCRLFREVFGNPFRRYTPQPSFAGGGVLTPGGEVFHVSETAHRIAEGVVLDGAFDRLPILADALEEGGCGDAELLHHLRHGTGHVRGCWALDVVLGKS